MVGLVGLVVLYFASGFVSKDQNEWAKQVSKIDISDHCVNNVYNSDYIGISIGCPNGLMAVERFNGYQKTPKEGVDFIDKTKNLKNLNVVRNEQEFTAFSISLNYKKFDSNNYFDTTESNSNTLNQVNTYNFIKKVEAVTGPNFIKVENIKQIKIGNNEYYVYSREKELRTDYFILIQGDKYIEFNFYNQNEDFIRNVLSSVKTFEPVRE